MKTLIILSLLSAAFAIPRPGNIAVSVQDLPDFEQNVDSPVEQLNVIDTDPQIRLPAPKFPDTERDTDLVKDQINFVEAVPLATPYLDTPENSDVQVVLAPEISQESNDEVKIVNNPEYDFSDFNRNTLLRDVKTRLTEVIRNKLNKINDNNNPTLIDTNTMDTDDVSVVQEAEISKSDENVKVVDSPAFSGIANDENIVSDVETDFSTNNELLHEISARIFETLTNKINEIRHNNIPSEDVMDSGDVSIIQEPEIDESHDKVKVVDLPFFSNIDKNDIVLVETANTPENIDRDFGSQNEPLREIAARLLEELGNRINRMRESNNPLGINAADSDISIAKEVELIQPYDEIKIVDSPVYSTIAKDDNIISDDIMKFINEPTSTNTQDSVQIVDSPQFDLSDLFKSSVAQQVIIIGTPLEIVETIPQFTETIRIVDTSESNQPPRIFKFQNPLLR